MRNDVALDVDDLALGVAHGAAVGVQHLRPLHHDVERRGLHRGQRARRPEEGEVLAVLAVAVPHGHGFDELVDGQVRLGCQILQRVGLVAEALGDRVGALEGVGAGVHGGLVADEPADFGHGQKVPVAAELHVAVARTHRGVHGHARVELVPIEGAAGVPIHVEAPSVVAYGNAEVLERAARAVVLAPSRIVELADGVPEAGAGIHVPLGDVQQGADAVAVAGVLLGGDGSHRGLGEIVGHHIGVALEAAAGHDDALVRLYAHVVLAVVVDAAEHRFGGRILHQGHERALGLQRDGRQAAHHLVHELGDVVPLAVLGGECGVVDGRGMLQLGVFGEAGVVGGAGDDGQIGVGGAELLDPIEIAGQFGREGGEHVVGRARVAVAQLLQIVEGRLLAVGARVHEPAAGKRAVAVAEGACALLDEQARGIGALLAHGDGRGHAGQARAHDEHVGFLVPGEVAVCGWCALGGAAFRAATCQAHARQPRNEKRRSRGLHEGPAALCHCHDNLPSDRFSFAAWMRRICYHAVARSWRENASGETPVLG